MVFDNIKSHKKAELHSLFRKHIFEKAAGVVGGSNWPSSPLRVKQKDVRFCSLYLFLRLFELLCAS